MSAKDVGAPRAYAGSLRRDSWGSRASQCGHEIQLADNWGRARGVIAQYSLSRKSRFWEMEPASNPASDRPIRPQKFFSQLEAPGIIQRQDGNSGPAAGC